MESHAVPTLETKSTSRLPHIDFLRVLAIFCVMYIHTNEKGQRYFLYEQSVLRWLYCGISICTQIAVPLFFMISGAMLLGKTEPIGRVLKNRVPRFAGILIVISVIYGIYNTALHGWTLTFYDYFKMIYSYGMYIHLWYLYSYIAFLLMLPMLRRMAQGMTDTEFLYLAAVALVINGIVPVAEYLLFKGDCGIKGELKGALFVTSNLFYPLMGYYFEHRMPRRYRSWKLVGVGVILSAVIVLVTAYMTFFRAGYTGAERENVELFTSSLTAVPVFTVYIAAKTLFERVKISQWGGKLLASMGSAAFGVYLFDQILREQTAFLYDFFAGFMPSPFASTLWVLCAMLLGMAAVTALKKVPVVRKLF